MNDFFQNLLMTAYFGPALILMCFGLNLYFILFLYLRSRKTASQKTKELMHTFEENKHEYSLPHVVTQIPLFNEYNVAERIIKAAVLMDYPPEKHTVQILDDSTDNTTLLVDRICEELSNAGPQIEVIRRTDRVGYKAGALQNGMEKSNASVFAIFDADFIPPKDFLTRTVPVLLIREEVGFVQARWGHTNAGTSLITRAQGVGIDGHFTVEQSGRAWNHLFMNFNGTAGLWRRKAIEDAGGWEHDTLTEDMDLSYRAQLEGWKPFFLQNVVVPAEIPENINAFKSQQFRWAKGSIQTALKLLPRIYRSPFPLVAKIQATFHMSHYMIHPIMVWLALLALPVLYFCQFSLPSIAFVTLFLFFLFSTFAPSTLYAISQCSLYPKGWRRLRYLPFLTFLGIGIAVSNSKAVLEALAKKPSGFVRTPKKGDLARKTYSIRMPSLALLELTLGAYSLASLMVYLAAHRFLIGPFLLLFTIGFLSVGLTSIYQTYQDSGWRQTFKTPSLPADHVNVLEIDDAKT